MSIIDKMAGVLDAHGYGGNHAAAAQAAWEVVKDEILGDGVLDNLIEYWTYFPADAEEWREALTAAIKKLEE